MMMPGAMSSLPVGGRAVGLVSGKSLGQGPPWRSGRLKQRVRVRTTALAQLADRCDALYALRLRLRTYMSQMLLKKHGTPKFPFT